MGIFQTKKTEEDADGVLHFFDDYFREELRKRGREYFEKVIDDDAALFRKDLDEVIAHVNSNLKDSITQQLDDTIAKASADITKLLEEKLIDYGKMMEAAQEKSLRAIEHREAELEEQNQQLVTALKRNVSDQDAMLVDTYKENAAHIAQMNEAQQLGIQMLQGSVKTLELQYQQLTEMMQNTVVKQEAMLIGAFEENMSRVIEHYLLGALGEQYDMKAQMPAIIQQMEANKKDMLDDMRL